MRDFFKSAKFKILAAVFILLAAFMLRATMSGGLTPITFPGAFGHYDTDLVGDGGHLRDGGGAFRHLFQAGELEQENAELEERVRILTQQVAELERYRR